jgi:glycolate oxidase FAD binding subunit
MTQTIAPTDAEQARDAIRWAVDTDTPLEVRGGGTKAALGRPMQTEAILDLSGLAGVTLYEPEELVISLKPGTPRARVERTLAEHGQMLAFEPPDFGPLFGAAANEDTIGGTIGINAAGPRRIKSGAARDVVLGVKGVSGFGEAFKSGGRVVKNVSGYDLAKLSTGSYGTLAALTEVTLKVAPKPETETTLVLLGLPLADACAALRCAASHQAEASAFAHLPADVAAQAPAADIASAATGASVIRLEGAPASLPARIQALAATLPSCESVLLEGHESAALWHAIRDVAPLGPPAYEPLWRISTPPSDAAAVLDANPSTFAYLDWAGGLIWMSRTERPVVANGTVTLFRADADVRTREPFLSEPGDVLKAITARVKKSFDPKAILNPGRMYEGV